MTLASANHMTELRLLAHATETVASDGTQARSLRVFCPPQQCSVEVSECSACKHVTSVGPGLVRCSPPPVSEAAGLEIPAGAVAAPTITLARADVPGTRLLSIMPPEPWALPVVDASGHFLGFVSRSELTIPGLPWRLAMALPAAALAVGSSLVVHEAVPLRRAIWLMAHRRARAIVLMDDAGVVRGALTDIGALGALGPR